MADWSCAHIIFSLVSKARFFIGILLQLGYSSMTCPKLPALILGKCTCTAVWHTNWLSTFASNTIFKMHHKNTSIWQQMKSKSFKSFLMIIWRQKIYFQVTKNKLNGWLELCTYYFFLASKARFLIGTLLQLGWSSNTCPPSWPMYPHSYMVDPPPKHVCEYKKCQMHQKIQFFDDNWKQSFKNLLMSIWWQKYSEILQMQYFKIHKW